MESFDEYLKRHSPRTAITKEEYDQAQQTLSKEEFERCYYTDYDTPDDSTGYYRAEPDTNYAMLEVLFEINESAKTAARSTRNVWLYLLTCIIIGLVFGFFYLILMVM